MTKYSKLISIVALCLIILFGFSIYQAQAQSGAPEIELVTEEGDSAQLDLLHTVANIYDYASYNRSTSYEFKNGEFENIDNQSVIQRMDYTFSSAINRYIEDYRSFMRGKTRVTDHFTETNDYLLYTAMQSDVNWRQYEDNTLSISVLDKETGEEQAHETLLTGGSYHTVIAAYVDYPSITIVTQAADENLDTDWLIYSVDLTDPEEELTPVINLGLSVESDNIQFSSSQTKTERFIPFRSLLAGKTDEYGQVMDHTASAYYVYDTQTQAVKEIPSFEEGQTVVLSEAETILVGNDLGEEIQWNEWTFDDESLTELGTTEMATPTIGRIQVDYYNRTFNQGLHLVDHHIYAYEDDYSEDRSRPLFQVIDIDSMSTTFSGYFALKETPEGSQVELSIYEYSLDHLQQ